jgi:hypothetical protein
MLNGSVPGVSAETAQPAQPAESDESEVRDVAEPARSRRRRRVFRKGTAESATDDNFGSSSDDTDAGWGEPAEAPSRDRWLEEQRPPHYE